MIIRVSTVYRTALKLSAATQDLACSNSAEAVSVIYRRLEIHIMEDHCIHACMYIRTYCVHAFPSVFRKQTTNGSLLQVTLISVQCPPGRHIRVRRYVHVT